MNLFEKIFNYQILSRLEDSGTFMVTAHERAWLKTMLEHPAADEAFMPETMDKLRSILEPDPVMDTAHHLIEKARTAEEQVYHPLLRPLRRYIMNKSGIRITYEIKDGQVKSEQTGIPYKLEYSMVKREWYLLWHHARHHAFMSTRLKKILSVVPEPASPAAVNQILRKTARTLESRKTEVVIELVRDYNEELSRILYAFSSFEKSVEYDAPSDIYRIKVTLLSDEAEYLLSKIRFLGKRVRVIEGDYLKQRMLEASSKALLRYGVEESPEPPEETPWD